MPDDVFIKQTIHSFIHSDVMQGQILVEMLHVGGGKYFRAGAVV